MIKCNKMQVDILVSRMTYVECFTTLITTVWPLAARSAHHVIVNYSYSVSKHDRW